MSPRPSRKTIRDQRRLELTRQGYTRATALALARVDDQGRRRRLAELAVRAGVADGNPRKYLIGLIDHELGNDHGHPTPASSLTPSDIAFIERRARELAERIRQDGQA